MHTHARTNTEFFSDRISDTSTSIALQLKTNCVIVSFFFGVINERYEMKSNFLESAIKYFNVHTHRQMNKHKHANARASSHTSAHLNRLNVCYCKIKNCTNRFILCFWTIEFQIKFHTHSCAHWHRHRHIQLTAKYWSNFKTIQAEWRCAPNKHSHAILARW